MGNSQLITAREFTFGIEGTAALAEDVPVSVQCHRRLESAAGRDVHLRVFGKKAGKEVTWASIYVNIDALVELAHTVRDAMPDAEDE